MAEPRAATSSSTVTVRRRRKDVTRWRRDPRAWPPARIGLLGLAGLALVGGVGTALSVGRIQDDLTDATLADLQAADIDTTGLDVDFSYRNGTISGVLPAGVTARDIRAAVDADGIRDLELDVDRTTAPADDSSGSPTDTTTTSAAATDGTTSTAPAAATGPTEVGAEYDGSTLTLTGTVLTEEQRATLVAAATEVVGADNVIDELEVSGLAEATDGADARVDDLAAVVAGFSGLSTAEATLTDTSLTISGEAPDQAAADAASALVADVSAVAGTADIAVLADGTATETTTTAAEASPAAADLDTEVTALQAELDGLAEAIRTTVVFPTGSSELSADARATLDQVAAAMARFPQPVVEISGHTDSRGSDQANQELSQRRAQAVVDYVASQGVDVSRLSARGAGETEPIAPNETDEGRSANRRVEFSARPSF